MRVWKSTMHDLSGNGIAGTSECTADAAVCVALRPAQHAERSLKTGGRSERSRLLVGGLGGAASGAVCRSRGLVGATSGVVATGHGTGGRNARRRLRVMGLVGAASGVVCWSWGWWAHRAESYASRGTGGRNERSRLLVMGLVGEGD